MRSWRNGRRDGLRARCPVGRESSNLSDRTNMVGVAQLVRAPDCGSGGRRFESGHSPQNICIRTEVAERVGLQIPCREIYHRRFESCRVLQKISKHSFKRFKYISLFFDNKIFFTYWGLN